MTGSKNPPVKHNPQDKNGMTKIFVGNLSYAATETELRQAFERYGRVRAVRILTDRASGRSRGFAFVDMANLDDADEAITRLNGTMISGRQVSVNEARSAADASPANDSSANEDRRRVVALLDSL
jgi:RNA recognition motif-containing protein